MSSRMARTEAGTVKSGTGPVCPGALAVHGRRAGAAWAPVRADPAGLGRILTGSRQEHRFSAGQPGRAERIRRGAVGPTMSKGGSRVTLPLRPGAADRRNGAMTSIPDRRAPRRTPKNTQEPPFRCCRILMSGSWGPFSPGRRLGGRAPHSTSWPPGHHGERAGFQSNAHLPPARSTGNLRVRHPEARRCQGRDCTVTGSEGWSIGTPPPSPHPSAPPHQPRTPHTPAPQRSAATAC